MKDGQLVWADAVGTTADGKALDLAGTFDTWSITKTYTAWLVYQLVESGQLSLDDPLPKITALPGLDTSGLTVRRLLDHSTGLMPYRDTGAYLANPSAIDDPLSAMKAVLAEPRAFEPGTKHVYSSTNYLVLGLLLEQVTGKPFATLLTDEIIEPFALTSTSHIGGTPGNPNFSTAGTLTDVVDLVTWAQLYLADHVDISDDLYAAMNTIDSSSAMGAGVIGYCPCVPNATGANDFAAIGYGGSTTEIEYAASDHVTIAINFTQSIWEPGTRYQDVVDLFGAIRTVVDARSSKG
jgi:CubicO group peptidase (beta-lactamase class C family)